MNIHKKKSAFVSVWYNKMWMHMRKKEKEVMRKG